MNRAVFLDRDGVLNKGVTRQGCSFAPMRIEDLELLQGVPQALAALKSAGYLLIVVTNQPDVCRGRGTISDVNAIHQAMRARLPLDDIRVCFHDEGHRCACRKPRPGMLYAAAVDREIDLSRSFMVGDRWRDIGAGQAAGCPTILVNRYPEPLLINPDCELPDLPAAAQWILDAR